MGNLLQDVRYGARTLIASPGFTLLTVLTLALAIGLNTTIFSLLSVVLIRDLPLRAPETLGFVYSGNAQAGIQQSPVAAADYLRYRDGVASFSELGAVNRGASFILTGVDEPVSIAGFEATANIFDIWGQRPVLGRTFSAEEDRPGAARVAMLAHGTWQRRFGSDPSVLGRVIRLDGHETTIIGVLDAELEFGSLAEAEVWVPLRLDPATANRETRNLWISGRLSSGATHERAAQEVEAISAALAAEFPETHDGWLATVFDMNQALAPDQLWTMFFLLGLTVAFVMLIACSNVATMMLSRAAARSPEIAIRVALGARRRRIIRQLLTESALLSLAAGTLGLGLARASVFGLTWMAGPTSGLASFLGLVRLDRGVLLFTLAISMAAPLLCGLLPALRAARLDMSRVLREGRGGARGGERGRRFLVATQVALALSLMVVAGLLIRTMINQRAFELGFDTNELLTMRVDLPDGRYGDAVAIGQFRDEVVRRVRALPTVREADWMSSRPGSGDDPVAGYSFRIEGEPEPEAQERPWAATVEIGPDARRVLGLPLLRGRDLEAADDPTGPAVVLVNAFLAETYFGVDEPLGRRIQIADGPEPIWAEIVGIVGNIHTGNPDQPAAATIYRPIARHLRGIAGLLVRVDGEPSALAGAIRREVWAVDPNQPVSNVRTMQQLIDEFLSVTDTIFSMFIAFALFAVAMASAGIYGVISFAVSRRTHEIGIRMALGARGGNVVALLTRQTTTLLAAGLGVGLIGAFLLSRLLASAIPGLSPTDPAALAGVVVVFTASALAAIWLPARRATRIDPTVALRTE